MSELFSPTQRYELWLRIELVVTEAWAEIGEIPKSAIARLRHATVNAEHIARLEERVGHDVVAFLDSLAESVGDDARYLHRGLTSSDILDTALDLRVEVANLAQRSLKVRPVNTRVIPRDRHAAYLTTLAVLGGSLEKFATDIRHLQRSEVSEVREPYGEQQKGSSAMPHKRNPILSERVCGLARVVRGYAQTALENQALWHERDISHSS